MADEPPATCRRRYTAKVWYCTTYARTIASPSRWVKAHRLPTARLRVH